MLQNSSGGRKTVQLSAKHALNTKMLNLVPNLVRSNRLNSVRASTVRPYGRTPRVLNLDLASRIAKPGQILRSYCLNPVVGSRPFTRYGILNLVLNLVCVGTGPGLGIAVPKVR